MRPLDGLVFSFAFLAGFARPALANDAAAGAARPDGAPDSAHEQRFSGTAPGASAARRSFLPYEGPKPILVWIQTDPWLMVIGSDTPRAVLYDDGELLFLMEEGRRWSYRHRRLEGAELDQLKSRAATVAALRDLKPRYDVAPNVTDQPETLLYLQSGQREVVTRIYGLLVKGTRLPAWTSFPSERGPDSLPGAVLELHRFLASLTSTEGSEWKPRYLEVMIWPYEEAQRSIQWPADWPGLTSDRTVERREGMYSIYLDAGMESELVAFLSKRRQQEGEGGIQLGGKKWAASVRPVIPSEPVWRKAFRNAATQ